VISKKEALQKTSVELLAFLQSSDKGLNEKEAIRRLVQYGPNMLKKSRARGFDIFLRQFQSPLIYLLMAAAVISYAVYDYSDGTVIVVILLINTLLGFFQEYKSEKIVEKLSEFISMQVRLKRGGMDVLLDQSHIVPGDIMIVREGDIVPADMKLLEVEGLQVNESQLSGESVPLMKKPENIVFAGSVVEKGMGMGIVYATANETELGLIAKLSTDTKKETQYQKSIKAFSSFLIKIVILGLTLVFLSKLVINGGTGNITELALFIIAMAVAVVPEALPIIATVSLSGSALKLAKKHVVVKRLSSLEDLGNVNMLCTDKTGTLTENKMIVDTITSIDSILFQRFAYAAVTPFKSRKRRSQNSYDDAFINYVSADIKAETKDLSIVKELPFDPDDKRSRLIMKDAGTRKKYLLSIGAPEVLLKLSLGHGAEYTKTLQEEGRKGLHHLAIAYKEIIFSNDYDILKNEHDLIFLGFASFEDPLRPTVKKTIEHAEKLGIQIKILTGDSREVAEYVGKQINLVGAGEKVYLGSELQVLSEHEFKKAVLACNVFARVSPSQKYDIIKSLKESYVVAYQGDGINDAPALKMADVAIAVNSAMDIAKENADIILLNKNLEVIINGITFGRAVFVNINKYIKYTMVSNFGNFIALSVLYLISTALPILPIQVLLTSLITDIPLIMIYLDTVEDDEVVRPEKHNVRELTFISLVLGVPTALFELFYFLLIRDRSVPVIQTSLYVCLTLIALAVFFAIRSRKPFWKGKSASPVLKASFFLAFVFSIAILYIPIFQVWLYFVPLALPDLVLIGLLVILYFLATDMIKVWYYKTLGKATKV
jgi:Mg2+-importing ATPase